jgi:hypothetical protein
MIIDTLTIAGFLLTVAAAGFLLLSNFHNDGDENR